MIQAGCLRQGAQGWCTDDPGGWDGEERFWMGNTCAPVADCNVWQKPLQYCN